MPIRTLGVLPGWALDAPGVVGQNTRLIVSGKNQSRNSGNFLAEHSIKDTIRKAAPISRHPSTSDRLRLSTPSD